MSYGDRLRASAVANGGVDEPDEIDALRAEVVSLRERLQQAEAVAQAADEWLYGLETGIWWTLRVDNLRAAVIDRRRLAGRPVTEGTVADG